MIRSTPTFPLIVRAALLVAALCAPGAATFAVEPPHESDCRVCHVPHGGVFVDATETLCRSCHFAGGPAPEMANHVVRASPPVTCVTCHDPHAQAQPAGKYLRAQVTAPSGAVRPVVLTAGRYLDLCLACHQETIGIVPPVDWSASRHGASAAEPLTIGTATTGFALAAPYDSTLRGSYALDCGACHQPHASRVGWLLRDVINGGPVVVATYKAATLMSVCDRCHPHTPRHHNDDVYGKSTSSCTVCHPYNPDAYADCSTSGCHGHRGRF
jgi:hypothetical protein